MPAVSSSKSTNPHRRALSNVNTSSDHISIASPAQSPNFSRRNFDRNSFGSPPQSPGYALNSPVAFNHRDMAYVGDSIDNELASAGRRAQGNGLGNLADELADAWDEEGAEDDEEEINLDFANPNGQSEFGSPDSSRSGRQGDGYVDTVHDMGIGGAGLHSSRALQQAISASDGDMLQPVARGGLVPNKHVMQHRRHESQYDGSDYGNDSDLEDAGGFTPALEARMSGIESLARRGTEENGSSHDSVIKRTVASMRDLGAQSGIENGATRLITAHTSLASHLTHQTRTLQTLTHPLLFSPFPSASSVDEDSLLPLIDSLLPNLPYPPQPTPLTSLTQLLAQTNDLIHTLRGLSDTLHESRQLTSTAARRLKSAKEIVAEMRKEEEEREEGERWIEKGRWDERLKGREAERVCGEVVGGFETVWEGWREKLFGEAGGSGGGGVDVAT